MFLAGFKLRLGGSIYGQNFRKAKPIYVGFMVWYGSTDSMSVSSVGSVGTFELFSFGCRNM